MLMRLLLECLTAINNKQGFRRIGRIFEAFSQNNRPLLRTGKYLNISSSLCLSAVLIYTGPPETPSASTIYAITRLAVVFMRRTLEGIV